MSFAMDGWDFGRFDDVEWSAWGSGGNARAKLLANGDGYFVALVEADAGYVGDPHEHAHTEFLFVYEGTLRSQGQSVSRGDAYVAAAGSTHEQFDAPDGATYLSIFKL